MVTIFCDTSVLVAASIRKHPHYGRARPVLQRVAAGEDTGVISAHSIAETFSALTSVPVVPRVLPPEARDIIAVNIRAHFQLVDVAPHMYDDAVKTCVMHGYGGGRVYDAVLLGCARQCGAERIYTFNIRDFRRLAPDLADRIVAP